MSSIEEIRNERLKKLSILEDNGINPYPATTNRTHTISEAINSFGVFTKFNKKIFVLAGRVLVRRGQGSILFVDFKDGSGSFQAVLKGDEMASELFQLFKDTVDGGDFLEFTGTLFTTKKGQKSLLVKKWKMLSKSLLPLPDKYHGLKDEDERFRKRYLDILQNDDLKELFERKAKFWRVTRSFMQEHNFSEVETPTLEVTTGGAEAKPFQTHHNDFDMDVYLRISVGELWQKRLIAAGYEKIFEIGRIYRNEGTSSNHLQEFINMEFYWAYVDYEDGMKFVEGLYNKIANDVYGTTTFTRGEYTFDFGAKWKRIDYLEEVKSQTGIDLENTSEDKIKIKLQELNIKYEGDNMERLTDTLWKYCRKNIAGPAFLINHPRLVSPLAKAVSGRESVTERFQPIIAGTEVGNGYSELNSPIEQKARFNLQKKLLAKGDDEAMMPDDEFVEMLEHGMPPTCGFGFGDRLFAILEDRPLRECQMFPFMRPKT